MATAPVAINSRRTLDKATVAATIGKVFLDLPSMKTFNAILRGSGQVDCVILLEGSNLPDEDSFNLLATITLSGAAGSAKDFGIIDAPWAYVRATLSSISGTSAAVDTAFGV